MAEIAWNTNELETLARNINNCRNALQTQQRRLIQLSRETQDGWKSDAGNLYATRLNEDIQELNPDDSSAFDRDHKAPGGKGNLPKRRRTDVRSSAQSACRNVTNRGEQA